MKIGNPMRRLAPATRVRSLLLVGVAMGLLGGVGCAPMPPGPDPEEDSDVVLAEVGDRTITDAELRERILDRYYNPRALLGLVREALFLEDARRLEIEVDDAELDAAVEAELAIVLGSTPGERQDSLEKLRWQGLRIEDVEEELRAELAGMLLIREVVAAHRNITDEDLREAYDASWAVPRRRVRHIAFPLRGDPSDEAAVEQVRNRAEAVRNALLSGASFAESARTLSGNPDTAAQGGEIGWLSRADFGDDALAEFVFALAVREISPIYREGEFGFHIFEVQDERAARPFEEVEAEIREQLRVAPPTDAEILEIESDLRLSLIHI